MRTIKFRGRWVKAKNALYPSEDKWVYGSLIVDGSSYRIKDGKISYKIDPKTVGQLTGITAIGDKDVYESDICNIRRYKEKKWEIGEVIYSSCEPGFHFRCYWGKKGKADYYGIRYYEIEEIEVIGSNYETPELI